MTRTTLKILLAATAPAGTSFAPGARAAAPRPR